MTNTEEGWRQKQCQRSSRLFNCSIPCEASCFASVDLKEKDEFNLLSPSFFYDDESDHVVLQDSSSVLHGATVRGLLYIQSHRFITITCVSILLSATQAPLASLLKKMKPLEPLRPSSASNVSAAQPPSGPRCPSGA